jgi:hypothetical protein
MVAGLAGLAAPDGKTPQLSASEKLLGRSIGMLYPNSVVFSPDIRIYVGMRQFVVRLVLRSGTYREGWLVLHAFESFRRTDLLCLV